MKFYLFLSSFLLFFCGGCSDNSTNIKISSTDDILKSKIIGSWTLYNNLQFTTFLSNGTFVDSTIFTFSSANISMPDTVTRIRYGKYNIVDSILYYSETHITTIPPNQLTGISGTEGPFYIYFDKDILHFIPVAVLDGSPNQQGIFWGEWSKIDWVNEYFGDKSYEGYQKTTYKFHKDSSFYSYKIEYLNISPFPTYINSNVYFYNHPYLVLDYYTNDTHDTLRVDFKFNKMRWFQDKYNFTLTKNN